MLVIMFVFASLAGIALATYIWRGHFAPWWMSVGHALIGVVALLLLIVSVIASGTEIPRLKFPLWLFLLAGMSGLYLASLHGRDRIASRSGVIAHACVALAGSGLLVAVVSSL